MRETLIFMIVVLLAAPCFAEDRVYSYTDETGQKIYTNEKRPSSPAAQQPSSTISPDAVARAYQRPVLNVRPLAHTGSTQRRFDQREPLKPMYQAPPPAKQQADFAPVQNNRHVINPFAGFAFFLSNIVLLMGIFFIFWLIALIDILRHEFTGSNKVIWFFAVTLLPVIGPALYYFIGSNQKVIDMDRIERPTDY